MRPKANIYQRVAAHQTMVIILYGWIEGRREENSELTIWECVQQFVKEKDIDCDINTLYQQYKAYAAIFRQFQRDKNK